MPSVLARSLCPVFSFLLVAAVSSAAAAELTGAGASFPAPLYAKWADAYKTATGNRVNYQSIGSSGGVKQIQAKTVDFGASDMPLTPEQLDKDGLIQFPTVVGGVVPVVNVPGIKGGDLRLNGKVLAQIYLGEVTHWNDPQIVALNPKLALPSSEIAPVRRADGSGTTFIFTHFLAESSEAWKQKVGEGATVQWPKGLGGKGNEGVAAFLQRLPSTIGYVEYAYAKQNKLAYVALANPAGHFVAPGEDSFKAAAAGAQWTKSAFYQVLTNQPGKDAWPITGATFILLQRTAEKPAQTQEVLKFFDWAFAHGSKTAVDMDYVPLPESVVKLIDQTLAAKVKDATGKPLWNAR